MYTNLFYPLPAQPRLCWTIARRLDSKCTFETFRKCTRQLQFPSNLKTGKGLRGASIHCPSPYKLCVCVCVYIYPVC